MNAAAIATCSAAAMAVCTSGLAATFVLHASDALPQYLGERTIRFATKEAAARLSTLPAAWSWNEKESGTGDPFDFRRL